MHNIKECGKFHCWCCSTCMNVSDAPCCSKCKDCTNVRRCGYKPPTKLDMFKTNVNVTNTMTDYIPISQAKKMRSGVSVAAEVDSVGTRRTVNLKNGGSVDVADAIIFDGPGEENHMKLTLWGEDIDLVSKGAKLTIENGYTNEFKGEVSLTKGKFGNMEVE